MSHRHFLILVLKACLLAALTSRGDEASSTEAKRSDSAANQPILPIPRATKLDPRKVRLGNRLFHDKNLSANGTVACATCHPLEKGGTDNQVFSKGANGALGTRNTPTVFNATFNFRQFWDGRAETLEQQIQGPLTHPDEMGSKWSDVLRYIKREPTYRSAFVRIYSDGVQRKNIKNAIATFERSLVTPDGRFDQFLQGDRSAITVKERHGYKLFKNYGCISCHQGVNVGGNMFQKLGIYEDYSEDVKGLVFKVPGLRNVALTSPYFHDGSARTLEDAVAKMARYQLGRDLSKTDIAAIVAFLKTLTGKYKGSFLDEPAQ